MKIFNRGPRNQAVLTKTGAVIVPAGKDVEIDDKVFIAPKGRKAKSYKDNHCFFSKEDLNSYDGALKDLDEEAAKASEQSKAAADALGSANEALKEAEKKNADADQKLKDAESLAEKTKAEKAESVKILDEAKSEKAEVEKLLAEANAAETNAKVAAKPTKEATGNK